MERPISLLFSTTTLGPLVLKNRLVRVSGVRLNGLRP
jgi:hypothetical protein